jgi:hypothetical protein
MKTLTYSLALFMGIGIMTACEIKIPEKEVEKEKTVTVEVEKKVEVPVDRPVDRIVDRIVDREVIRYDTSNQCEGLDLDVSIFNPWIARSPDEYLELDFRGGIISDTAWKAGLKIKFYLTVGGLQRINDYHRDATGLVAGDRYECEYSYRVPLNLPPFGVISTLKEGLIYLHHPDINTPQDNVCLEMIGTGGATFGFNILANHTYKVEGTKLTLKFFGGRVETGHPVIIMDLDCID